VHYYKKMMRQCAQVASLASSRVSCIVYGRRTEVRVDAHPIISGLRVRDTLAPLPLAQTTRAETVSCSENQMSSAFTSCGGCRQREQHVLCHWYIPRQSHIKGCSRAGCRCFALARDTKRDFTEQTVVTLLPNWGGLMARGFLIQPCLDWPRGL
jgi:hypothetical protein